MKIYIAYRFSGQDKDELKNSLSKISKVLTDAGHETFIFFRDEQNWGETTMPPKEIILSAFRHVESNDCLLAIQNSAEKSEGLLLEVGYAKGLGKQIVLAIKQDVSAVFLRGVADKIIEYNSDEELLELLKQKFTR